VAVAELPVPARQGPGGLGDALAHALHVVGVDVGEEGAHVPRQHLIGDAAETLDGDAGEGHRGAAVLAEVEGVEGARNGLRHRGEEVLGLQLAAHGALGDALLALVTEDQDDAVDLPVGAADRGAAVGDGALAAVAGDEQAAAGEPDHPPLAQDPVHRVVDRLPGALVDDPEHLSERPVHRRGRRPPGQLLGDAVEDGDARLGVGGDDRVPDAAQGDRQSLLLGGQALGRELALGDHLAEEDHPALLAGRVAPGSDLPAHPVDGPVGAREGVLLARLGGAREAAPVDLPPALGDLREHLVVAAADEVPDLQAIGLGVVPARHEVAHLSVEHRHRGRSVLDELSEHLLADCLHLDAPPGVDAVSRLCRATCDAMCTH
jgi:hypothetical protein